MNRAVIYMFGASFFFAIMQVLVKMLPNIPSVEIVFFRSIISLIISGTILKANGVPLFGTQRKYLVLRGLVGAVSLILYFYTLQRIPLATAVTLQFLAPVFTAIIGVFAFREKVTFWQWFFFGVSFAGVLLVQGFDIRVSWEFVVIGIISALFAGMAYNLIRKIGPSEHPLVIVFYFPLVTTPVTGIWSATNWVMPQGMEWIIVIAIGIVVQIAQTLLTMSYQMEEVSKIAPIKYFGIVYALLFGWFIFEETYTIEVYAGMSLVIIGVILNVLYKNWLKRKKLSYE